MSAPSHLTSSALIVEGLSKSFAGTLALADVDIAIASGEVRGLVGANGSGKSTLVKVLSGYHHPDSIRRLAIGGRDLAATSFTARDIQAAGVAFVHQDLALIDQCSIADNFAFGPRGFPGSRALKIDWARHLSRVRDLLARVGLDVDPRSAVGTLGPAEKTLVAIARAIGQFDHAHLLVLDEPTARLPYGDVDMLLERLRGIAAAGAAILYVTHRMNELFSFADSITVIRDGSVVSTIDTSLTSLDRLTELMVGSNQAPRDKRARAEGGRDENAVPAAEFEDVSTDRLRGVSLSIHAGEILALTGAIGSGAEDCGELLYGLRVPLSGSIKLNGTLASPLTIASARAARVAFLPPERTLAGFSAVSTGENIVIADYRPVTRGIHIDDEALQRDATAIVRKMAVHPSDPKVGFRSLSGGNQQKALLGKWLRVRPRLLVLCEPTHGVDVISRMDLYREIEKARDGGVAVLWITSDLDEAEAVADRIGVFFHGELRLIADATKIDAAQINRAALGF